MASELGEVGAVTVTRFTGPAGRRESYQLTGPHGYVQLTLEELAEVVALIEQQKNEG